MIQLKKKDDLGNFETQKIDTIDTYFASLKTIQLLYQTTFR